MAIKRIHARSPFYITSSDSPIAPPTSTIEYFSANCGDVKISDGFIGRRNYVLTLTGDTGDITIDYSGGNTPVKITLYYDGSLVSTGYVGLDAYDSQLIALGIDPSDINTGPTSTKTGSISIPKTTIEPKVATITVDSPIVNDNLSLTFDCPDVPSTAPTCPDRALVFQICNSNSAKDDNFDVYLNNNYIGFLDLNSNAQVGSVFIATTNASADLISGDFVCPLTLMDTYRFDPSFVLYGTNTLELRNAQNNGNGNYGVIGVRNYLVDGDDLSTPCVVANLEYSGSSGSDFTLTFDYTACCPED